MRLGGAGWVKNFSVGICDDTPSTAHSSFFNLYFNFVKKYLIFFIHNTLHIYLKHLNKIDVNSESE